MKAAMWVVLMGLMIVVGNSDMSLLERVVWVACIGLWGGAVLEEPKRS